MKARKVKGLDPDARFDDTVHKILALRLAELRSFAAPAADPADVEALHDMRIAAKRVRYIFEIAEPALGPGASKGVKAAKELQDVLGEIHDCDELLPLVRRHVKKLRAQDVAAAAERAQRGDLPAEAAREAPNRTKYRGLESLATYLAARRQVLYATFLARWPKLDAAIERAAERSEQVAA